MIQRNPPSARSTSPWTSFVVAQIFGSTAVGMTTTLSTLSAAHLADSVELSALAPAATAGSAALLSLLTKSVVRRIGWHVTVAVGYLVAALGAAVAQTSVSTGSLPGLVGGCVLLGAGSVAGLSARFGAAESAPPGRAIRAMSMVLWASTAGVTVGPLLAMPLIGRLSSGLPAGLFVPITLANLCAAIVLLTSARRGVRPPLSRETGAAPAPEPSQAFAGVTRREPASIAVGRGTRPTRRGVGFVIAACGAHAIMVSLMSMAPVHMSHSETAASMISVAMSLHLGCMYVASPLFGAMAAKWGATRCLLLGLVGAAGAACIMVFSSGPLLSTTALCLLGLAWSCSIVAASSGILTVGPGGEGSTSRRRFGLDAGILWSAAASIPLAGIAIDNWDYAGLAVAAVVVAVISGSALLMTRR